MKSRFTPTVAMNVRITLELREKVEKVKEETGKSLNRLVAESLEQYLKKTTKNSMERAETSLRTPKRDLHIQY